MDPSSSAAAPVREFGQLVDFLLAGGPVLQTLLAFSVAALAIVIAKLLQFRAMDLGNRALPRRVLDLHRTGRNHEALQLAQSAATPVAQVLTLALRGQSQGLPEAKVREEALRHGAALLEDLRSWLRPLETIASLAPLLGLFGTVLGMIEAFRQMELAGSRVDPSVLSGGIWEALLTTAAGLAVAIPAVMLLTWLERRVERTAHAMEDALTQVFVPDLSPAAVRQPARGYFDDRRTAAPGSVPGHARTAGA